MNKKEKDFFFLFCYYWRDRRRQFEIINENFLNK